MPTYDTPEPIAAIVDIAAGRVRITASERADTTVEVRPSDGQREADVTAAAQARVEYAGGTLLVKATHRRRLSAFFDRPGSIDIAIGLPAGSHVNASAAAASFRAEGRLGDLRLKCSLGDVALDQAALLNVATTGDITVDRATGPADITTASGEVRVRTAEGAAVIKNSNGDTWVGEAHGDLRLKSANGSITVDRAHAGTTATTANGDVRVGAVVQGVTVLETAVGDLDIGIAAGTAARIDATTRFGSVHRHLDAADGPRPSEAVAEVRARTACGDIALHRS